MIDLTAGSIPGSRRPEFRPQSRFSRLSGRWVDLEAFRAVPGLIQKYYLKEVSTGAISGIYIFEDQDTRKNFWESGLARMAPERYGVLPETLRVEEYDMSIVLNDEYVA